MSASTVADAIGIDRYAEVMAHLRYFPADKHAEVIARLGIRQGDFQAAAKKWQTVRDAERAGGKLEVTARFGRIFAATRAMLDAQRPSLESLGPLPGPDGALGVPPPLPPALPATPFDAASGSQPPIQVPTYIAAEQGTWGQGSFPRPQPLAGPVRAPEQSAVVQPPMIVRPPAALAATSLGAVAPVGSVMPFSTADKLTGDAFERAVAHAEGVAGPRPAPARPAVGSETVGVGTDAAGRALPPGLPDLTVEQYASLSVELKLAPDRVEATLARYGLSTPRRDALDAHWKARFAADPPLRMTFAARYAKYAAYLQELSQDLSSARSEAPGGAPGREHLDLTLLPLETYAKLSAALARGELREAALRRHGLTPAAFDILARAWAQKFQQEPALLERFKELARGGMARGGDGPR
jgi:hypothetical protein